MGKRYKFEPDYAVHPGETLQEILDEWKLNPRIAAKSISMDVEMLKGILDGSVAISCGIAEGLKMLTHVPASFWIRAEENYQRDLKRLGKRRPKAKRS